MAESGWQDFKNMASWAANKASSRPIKRIEKTMDTGRPAPEKPWTPAPRQAQRGVTKGTAPSFRRYGPAPPKRSVRKTTR